jgi:hypothetical protein
MLALYADPENSHFSFCMELVAVKEKCSFPSYIFKKLEEDNII